MISTDENIMGKVAAGEISKCSILFDRHHVSVYNYFMKINRNKMLAEDLTQNVFEKLIKYRSSYNQQKNFKAWLFTIARNANIDKHRKMNLEVAQEDHMDFSSDELGAHEQLERNEKNEILLAALNQLPAEEKEIIVLTKLQRLKFSEVSQIMGISENSLKVKSHRTIKKLRTILVNDIRYEY